MRGGKAQRPRTAYLIPAWACAVGGARDSDRHWLSKELLLLLFLQTFVFCCSVVSRSANFGAWSARIDAGRRALHFSTEKLGLIRRFSGRNAFEREKRARTGDFVTCLSGSCLIGQKWVGSRCLSVGGKNGLNGSGDGGLLDVGISGHAAHGSTQDDELYILGLRSWV